MQAQAEEDEFRRAKERLTLKHKNTSRWARRALKRGLSLASDEQRDAIHEQLRLGRELKAKAASAHAGSDSDTSCAASSDVAACVCCSRLHMLKRAHLLAIAGTICVCVCGRERGLRWNP